MGRKYKWGVAVLIEQWVGKPVGTNRWNKGKINIKG